MTIPLSHDQTSSILGIDTGHSGLLCRADIHCRERFLVLGNETTAKAAELRGTHEREVHGYEHVVTTFIVWGFTAKTSARGRSRLGRSTPR